MRFSVLIPAYNVENKIERCVNSVLKQSYSDYEIIIVDDGSSDATAIICDEYAKNNKQISVCHKENDGLYMARLSAIEMAAGEYLLFVDSDDYIEENTLQILNSYIEKNKSVDMFIFREIIDIGGNEKISPRLFDDDEIFDVSKLVCKLTENSDANNLVIKCVRNYQSENFPKIHHFNNAEDIIYTLNYSLLVKKIQYINQALYHYCINNDSITRNLKVEDLYNSTFARDQLLKVLNKLQINDKHIRGKTSNGYLKNVMIYFSRFEKRYIRTTEFHEAMDRIIQSEMFERLTNDTEVLSTISIVARYLLRERYYGLIRFIVGIIRRRKK